MLQIKISELDNPNSFNFEDFLGKLREIATDLHLSENCICSTNWSPFIKAREFIMKFCKSVKHCRLRLCIWHEDDYLKTFYRACSLLTWLAEGHETAKNGTDECKGGRTDIDPKLCQHEGTITLKHSGDTFIILYQFSNTTI